VALGTLLLTFFLYNRDSRLLPGAGTRGDPGISQAAADDRVEAMAAKQQELAGVILADPAVRACRRSSGGWDEYDYQQRANYPST